MVFFYTCSDPRYVVFMGRDKYENETLIEYGFDAQMWFHVDDYSSAHVYLQMPIEDQDPQNIPSEIVEEMCQLTKNNSIEGSKASTVNIVYTPWSNLHKTNQMDVGAVGYKDNKKVTIIRNIKTNKETVKRLEKTKEERPVDLAKLQQDYRREMIQRRKKEKLSAIAKSADEKKKQTEEANLKSYQSIFANMPDAGVRKPAPKTAEEARQFEEDALW